VDKFQHFKIYTQQQLKRELEEKEVKFLKWVFKRYENEQNNKSEEKDPIT